MSPLDVVRQRLRGPQRPEPVAAGMPERGRRVAVTVHLSSLPVAAAVVALAGRPVFWAGVLVPLGPLVVWGLTRPRHAAVRRHVLEAVDFTLSIALYTAAAAAALALVVRTPYTLMLLPVFLLMLLAVAANWLILSALAALDAARDAGFSYPASLRLVRRHDEGRSGDRWRRAPGGGHGRRRASIRGRCESW